MAWSNNIIKNSNTYRSKPHIFRLSIPGLYYRFLSGFNPSLSSLVISSDLSLSLSLSLSLATSLLLLAPTFGPGFSAIIRIYAARYNCFYTWTYCAVNLYAGRWFRIVPSPCLASGPALLFHSSLPFLSSYFIPSFISIAFKCHVYHIYVTTDFYNSVYRFIVCPFCSTLNGFSFESPPASRLLI